MFRKKKIIEGFTLIELLVVIIIMGILAGVVVPRLAGRTEQARRAAAQAQLDSFTVALDTFELDNGNYPSTSEGLESLWTQPSGAKNWNGPYLQKKIPLDPWANEWHYSCPGTRNPLTFDLASYGKDGVEGGGDDITNY